MKNNSKGEISDMEIVRVVVHRNLTVMKDFKSGLLIPTKSIEKFFITVNINVADSATLCRDTVRSVFTAQV